MNAKVLKKPIQPIGSGKQESSNKIEGDYEAMFGGTKFAKMELVTKITTAKGNILGYHFQEEHVNKECLRLILALTTHANFYCHSIKIKGLKTESNVYQQGISNQYMGNFDVGHGQSSHLMSYDPKYANSDTEPQDIPIDDILTGIHQAGKCEVGDKKTLLMETIHKALSYCRIKFSVLEIDMSVTKPNDYVPYKFSGNFLYSSLLTSAYLPIVTEGDAKGDIVFPEGGN